MPDKPEAPKQNNGSSASRSGGAGGNPSHGFNSPPKKKGGQGNKNAHTGTGQPRPAASSGTQSPRYSEKYQNRPNPYTGYLPPEPVRSQSGGVLRKDSVKDLQKKAVQTPPPPPSPSPKDSGVTAAVPAADKAAQDKQKPQRTAEAPQPKAEQESSLPTAAKDGAREEQQSTAPKSEGRKKKKKKQTARQTVRTGTHPQNYEEILKTIINKPDSNTEEHLKNIMKSAAAEAATSVLLENMMTATAKKKEEEQSAKAQAATAAEPLIRLSEDGTPMVYASVLDSKGNTTAAWIPLAVKPADGGAAGTAPAVVPADPAADTPAVVPVVVPIVIPEDTPPVIPVVVSADTLADTSAAAPPDTEEDIGDLPTFKPNMRWTPPKPAKKLDIPEVSEVSEVSDTPELPEVSYVQEAQEAQEAQEVQETQEVLAEDTPADEVPTEESLTDEAPTEEVPAEETPAEESPAEESTTEEEPAEESPADEVPAEEAPTEDEQSDEPSDEFSGEEQAKDNQTDSPIEAPLSEMIREYKFIPPPVSDSEEEEYLDDGAEEEADYEDEPIFEEDVRRYEAPPPKPAADEDYEDYQNQEEESLAIVGKRKNFETRMSGDVADFGAYGIEAQQDSTLFIRKRRSEKATAVFNIPAAGGHSPDFDDDDFFEQWLEEGDEMIIKDRQQRRRVSTIIGAVTMVFAVIGFAMIVNALISRLPSDSTNSKYLEYEEMIRPIVLTDPAPFETLSAAEQPKIVESAIVSLMDGNSDSEDDVTYQTEETEGVNRIIIPSADVVAAGQKLFGEEFEINTDALYSIEDNMLYYYSEIDDSFHVTVTGMDGLEPRITRILKSGDTITLYVGYLSDAEDEDGDNGQTEFFKELEYVLRVRDDGSYYVAAIRESDAA
ncbi:MAG: hypothetical protein LBL82_05215 [Oscillospiraceae bacterium]|jgi:hypothetical protein|nr:hypothetical protein [Oscillospiraceae bacterium]